MRFARVVLYLVTLAAGVWASDLDAIRGEPNLEKRSDRALAHANRAISTAREAYGAGDIAKTKAALAEVTDAVELSWESLRGTGKHPRRSPKHFKRAEVSLREMLRRLKNLEQDFNVDDRPLLVATEERLQTVHDRLIEGIMGKKK